MTDAERMLNVLMDMGCELMGCNAEIHRIEDTLQRMGAAFGAARMDVFAITSSVIVTMTLPDGQRLTQTRRIEGPSGFDFQSLILLNQLSREYCAGPCTVEELEKRLQGIRKRSTRYAALYSYAGSVIVGGSFAMFFGGTFADGIAGAVCGAFTCLTQRLLKKAAPNQLIFQLLNALLIGMLICLTGRIFPQLHPDRIMIGDIMLLIPGIAMTNSLKDMLTGDTISGLLRLVETIIWASALAAGFMVSIALFPATGEPYTPGEVSVVLQLILSFFGSLGFSLIFGVPEKHLVPASIGGVVCWAGYILGTMHMGMNVLPASAFAAVLSSLYAEIAARGFRVPAPPFLIAAFIPLIPGSGMYYTMSCAVAQDWHKAGSYGISTLFCALGMAFGMSMVFALFDMRRSIRTVKHRKPN